MLRKNRLIIIIIIVKVTIMIIFPVYCTYLLVDLHIAPLILTTNLCFTHEVTEAKRLRNSCKT